jgi:cellulose synthase/poly-beta-1,6-N-acetylglucosamine synthase-like glycosyltransferase
VHELVGLTRDEIMPPVVVRDEPVVVMNGASVLLYSNLAALMTVVFYLGIGLGTLRLLAVTLFAYLHDRFYPKPQGNWRPRSVAVVIPAYNEEKVIVSSILALLASPYRKFEIIVVDDGSSDNTYRVVKERFARTNRVRVFKKPNGGKSTALNYGFAKANADVVIAIDADTMLHRDAIPLLLQHFKDPRVGAVAGATCVGNAHNLITGFQALEYATSQNLDRRAFELANAISVVPGSIGAWRREAMLGVGGYSSDTLAEDADVTIKLERAGWRVAYEPRAFARTEAPESLRTFLKQRFRWMFGTLQVAFKHRGAVLDRQAPGVAFVALPNIFIFQFLFTLISPIIDLMLLSTVVSGVVSYSMHPLQPVPSSLTTVATFWIFFQTVELLTSAVALKLARQKGIWRLLPLLLIQRFCYRQLLYVAAVRVAVTAIKGNIVGWG